MRLSQIKLIATVLVVALLAVVGWKPISTSLNLGLDLQGGLHVVLQARPITPGTKVTDDAIKRTIEVLQRRVNETGVKEPIIQGQGSDRIIVELAGVKNPDDAIKMIGKTAVLQFKTQDGKVVLTGNDLADAQTTINPTNNQPEVSLKFTTQGAEKFAKVTTENVNKQIGIYLDEQLLTNPKVIEPILNGQASINGQQSVEEAENISKLLRAGALPLNLDFVEKRIVGPTLGADSLNKSKLAAMVGIAAILIFMLAVYRLPGLVANFTLVVYTILVLGVMAAFHATLTLPGIAAFLLSIGIAVDANVIIFERLKEELRAGKTLRSSIQVGFKRAVTTVLDSNATTSIAALTLYFLGTASIRGFALTLLIGIVCSLFTAITLTRWLLIWLADIGIKNNKLYGA
ncbi:MAG TPA: protein translocase subunit SecD [Bacillota bacterium]|nr:protein translocase subunit SecD [Bacillota bacterium]